MGSSHVTNKEKGQSIIVGLGIQSKASINLMGGKTELLSLQYWVYLMQARPWPTGPSLAVYSIVLSYKFCHIFNWTVFQVAGRVGLVINNHMFSKLLFHWKTYCSYKINALLEVWTSDR